MNRVGAPLGLAWRCVVPQNTRLENQTLFCYHIKMEEKLPDLTIDEQRFALMIAEGKRYADAYRECFPESAARLTEEELRMRSSALRGTKKIKEWLQALYQAGAQKQLDSLEEYISMLKYYIGEAEKKGNFGAVSSLMNTLGRSMALLTDKVNVVHTDSRTLAEQVEELKRNPQFAEVAKVYEEKLGIKTVH